MNDKAGTTQEALRALPKEKAELLRLLLQKERRQAQKIGPYPRIPTADGKLILSVSWAQQRLWFIDVLEGATPAYNIGIAVRLRGKLDRDALRSSLNAIVQRHEVLRTVFLNVEGEPRQQVAAEGHFPISLVDLCGIEPSERDRELHQLKSEEGRTPFNLGEGPLLRGRLVRLQPEESVLLITMHHIVSDGWSMGVFIDELTRLYTAYRDGRDNPLPPLPIQYSDYAQWQREWLSGRALESQLSYWRARLANAPPVLDLPLDRPRPPVQSYRGERLAFQLDKRLIEQLQTLAQRHSMTLFMITYAAWAILLSRLSGQDDVSIGTPVANRRRPELERLIGFLVNTLVLRVRVRKDSSVREFFGNVRDVTLEAYDNQDLPFDKIVEVLQPERRLSHHPLFQVMFALQNAPKNELDLPGLIASIDDEVNEYSKFDVLLSMEEKDGSIVANVHYATDLFDRQTIQRWMSCYFVLLRDLVERDEVRIGDLSILSAEERSQVVRLFNATEVKYPNSIFVHELFEQQAARAPEIVAVAHENQRLTYAELNGRANRLARHLIGCGIGPGKLVAVCIERSLDMIVSLVGVMKAGGAYVPLDPSYPAERLHYMVEDAAPDVILTHKKLITVLPRTTSAVVVLDESWSEIGGLDEENPLRTDVGLTSTSLIYVIYTSGSTGRPKGTAMPHSAMLNLIEWHRNGFHLNPGTRVLQFAALSFDVAFQEVFSTLCSGATLVLLNEWIRRDAGALAELLNSGSIDRMFLPPMMLQSIAESCQASNTYPYGLADVITAGEQLRISPEIATFFRRVTGCRLHNHYGPTETHVVTALTLRPEPAEWPILPAIGRPISNTQIYVLDECTRPVPIGVVGEIYIGGASLACGYLRRPDVTAQRFVDCSFDGEAPRRLYKTGDLGRWRADGTVEYLGRNDDQVKIRGYRVELGEIEDRLAGHIHVKEAAVVLREDSGGGKRLLAYVTQRGKQIPSVDELRAHLATSLPEYMIPGAIVVLKEMPLTASGKLNRRILPLPELDAYVMRPYEAPQGRVEEILASIWRELLGVERVGRQDNFFELGGHSLLIVKIMERLRRLRFTADIRTIYVNATLAGMARALERNVGGDVEVPPNLIPDECTKIAPEMLTLVDLSSEEIESIVRMVPGGAKNVQDVYPLLPLQEGMLFHYLLNRSEGVDAYLRPMYFSLSSREKGEDLVRALQAVIDRHDVLRTAVLWEKLSQSVQVVYRHAVLPVEVLALDADEDPVDQMRKQIAGKGIGLDLRHAPMMKLYLASSGDRWYALLLTHHLIFDNESGKTMLGEVMAEVEGRKRISSDLGSYRDQVAQTLVHMRATNAEEFFRRKLMDVDEPTAPFGILNVHSDGMQTEAKKQLDAELSKRVRTQAKRLSVTPATLFHAAWALVVARTSGRDDVVFGTVLLGRMHGSAERMLGMFINTLPLRVKLRRITANELVERTQGELVDLLAHEHASLAIAQRCSGVAPPMPLFSTLLNYRHRTANLAAEAYQAAGVTLLASEGGTNYPIMLSVVDYDEGFSLEVQSDKDIEPYRVMEYTCAAMGALVEALEKNPETPAVTLTTLPENERRHVIDLFNATYRDVTGGRLLHEFFEEQVVCTPDAIAVVHKGQWLTYKELNCRANQLARFLSGRGVGPDSIVGICVERGLELVVGLLGVLKSGGAYVPLDPAYPVERLSYMLKDAAPRVVLTLETLRQRLPSGPAEVIALDENWSQLDHHSSEDLDGRALGLSPRNLAYVIYTSGSTGNPKGVMIEHRSVVNFLISMRESLGINATDCLLAVTTVSFDISALEIYLPLISGAKTVVASREAASDAHQLMAMLDDFDVTMVQATPATWQLLLSGGWSGRSKLKALCGGEALKSDLSLKLTGRSGTVWNLYGPTETTIWSCCRQVEAPERRQAVESIGRPILNTRVYILDKHREVLPIDAMGEIYIGGAGVARGYLNRPELTAERFVPDPFSPAEGARLYQTGDLGRWRLDGVIEYLGRNDYQVKMRGFRIELGEIEAQLASHPKVNEAVLLAREDAQGEKRLVAYITSRDQKTASVEELRGHLKKLLPEYMVPTAFVMLERLPVTPNGKLDRHALPEPKCGAFGSPHCEEPMGDVERILATIWCELLRVERIGRQDNFFELGGHSLIAIKLIVRITEKFGVEMTVPAVFRCPMLWQMAEFIEHLSSGMAAARIAEKVTLDEGVI